MPNIAFKLLVCGAYREKNCCRVFGFNMGLSLLPVKFFYRVSFLNSFAARSWLNPYAPIYVPKASTYDNNKVKVDDCD